MRITASWVWVFRSAEYKDVARDSCTMRAPLDFVIPTTAAGAVVLEAVKAKPFGGPPKGGPAVDCSCARASNRQVWVGTKKRAVRSNKETEGTKKMDRTLGEPS